MIEYSELNSSDRVKYWTDYLSGLIAWIMKNRRTEKQQQLQYVIDEARYVSILLEILEPKKVVVESKMNNNESSIGNKPAFGAGSKCGRIRPAPFGLKK